MRGNSKNDGYGLNMKCPHPKLIYGRLSPQGNAQSWGFEEVIGSLGL
jgi:hypothetical protein